MRVIRSLLLAATATAALAQIAAAQPTTVSYQGQLVVSGSPYTGTAHFKFAIISGSTSLWSNDGTSVAGSEPSASVDIDVVDGAFNVRLGDPVAGMQPITADLLGDAMLASLRMWVNTGGLWEVLTDQPLSSVLFALHSETADRALSGFTANGVIQSTAGGFKFPDGTTQSTAAFTGSAGTLDEAYDHGGPGVGRTIQADAGAVEIQGTDGLVVSGSLGVGGTPSGQRLRVIQSDGDGAIVNGGSTPDSATAIIGIGQAPLARGVTGRAAAGISDGRGVYGVALGTNGVGVYGMAAKSSTSNIGVYGSTNSSAGWAGYFNARVYAKSLEIAPTDRHASFAPGVWVGGYTTPIEFAFQEAVGGSNDGYAFTTTGILGAFAPIRVPDNATVTRVRVRVYDGSTTADIPVELDAVQLGTVTALGSASSSGSSGYQSVVISGLSVVVDTDHYAYQLRVDSACGSGCSDLQLGEIIVDYTVDHPLP